MRTLKLRPLTLAIQQVLLALQSGQIRTWSDVLPDQQIRTYHSPY